MASRYSDAALDINPNRWYCTRFFVEQYRRDVDWETIQTTHDRTAEIVRKLLSAYIENGTFSDEELTAVKSVLQVSHTIGLEKTIERIEESRFEPQQRDDIVDQLEQYGDIGIVGGTAYSASVPTDEVEEQLLRTFETILNEDASTADVDAAVKTLLELRIENVGLGTLSALLSLLHPHRYPVINEQTITTLETCLGIDIPTSTVGFLEAASLFQEIRDDFGFESHLRHLDYFCYWANEQMGVTEWFQQNNITGRDVWQINAGHCSEELPDEIWSVWKKRGVCSLGNDVGDLTTLSEQEIKEATRSAEDESADESLDRFQDELTLRRFGDELTPGTILLAKDRGTLLGIGVIQKPGYQYKPGYLDDNLDASLDHHHLHSVNWTAVPSNEHPSVAEWSIGTELSARKTLVRATEFESIRFALAIREPELLSDLVEIERRVSDVKERVLNGIDRDNTPQQDQDDRTPSYDGVSEATDEVLRQIDTDDANLLTTDLLTEEVTAWTKALSGIEPNVKISRDDYVQCQRLLDLYDELEDELTAMAEQHDIGSVNRASPPETVFIALVRDIQSRAGARVNLNQVKWGVLREEAFEVKGDGHIEAPLNPPEDAEIIAQQLAQTGQMVFYGPPGTGKTYTAQQFARWWIADQTDGQTRAEQLELTTFHPSFAYEDFIEGLTAKENDGAVEYDIEPGVFKEICERAKRAYENSDDPDDAPPYILIIDEINRGNLAQIFGELMTLLEKDKRLDAPNEARSNLAHSNESFVIPPNLYLIGTMNTADESIALLDAALRRRFRFQPFPPDFDTIVDTYEFPPGGAETIVKEGGTRRDQLVAASILALEELNEQIRNANQLGKGKQLGHTHLFGHENADEVRDTWRFDILPQLEDYYFGKFDRLRTEIFDDVTIELIDWDTERIEAFATETLYRELCVIAGIEQYAPLEAALATDGAQTAEDGWAAGERTPETFRERVEQHSDETLRNRLIDLWELGDELGELDPGRGEYTASVTMDLPEYHPGVGLYQMDDKGKFGFRWNWFLSRDDNDLIREDIENLQSTLTTIDSYEIEWRDPAAKGEDPHFEDNSLYLDELTEAEFDQLTEVIREVTGEIQSEMVDAEN